MEDIQVGEWIRTKTGLIRKVKTLYSGKRQFTRTTETLINGKFKLEDIVKSSDVLFLTVPDGSITEVYREVVRYPVRDKFICHCRI